MLQEQPNLLSSDKLWRPSDFLRYEMVHNVTGKRVQAETVIFIWVLSQAELRINYCSTVPRNQHTKPLHSTSE